jgi:hypothetical protein
MLKEPLGNFCVSVLQAFRLHGVTCKCEYLGEIKNEFQKINI